MTIAPAELQVDEGQKLLHVVVLPYPAKGHSIPLLHFAKRLHSMGVLVTYINTYQHLAAEHLRTLDGVDSTTMRVVPMGVPPPEGEGTGSLPYGRRVNSLVPDAVLLFDTLFARNPDAPPACIVSDMFLGWTQVVADKFKIPRYVMFASPGSALATMLHMPELIKQGRLPIDRAKELELVYDIPGVPPTCLADLPSPIQDSAHYLYPFYIQNCYDMHEAAGVLLNTYYELEPSYIDALRQTEYGDTNGKGRHLLSIMPVGPMLPKAYFTTGPQISTNAGERDACLKWLDTQPEASVLYVSFGSVAKLSVLQIQELAMGLEMSGQRFLLVLRPPDNPENLPLFPEGFEELFKGRGFVHIGWAPQLFVLSHPAVGGFLTHCGWNSSLETICRGLPMLTWPIQAEQAMNARFLVDDVKIAFELRTVTDGLIPKEKVSNYVKLLMASPEGDEIKKNARKQRDLALAAVSEGGSVEKNFNNFLQELRSRKSVY